MTSYLGLLSFPAMKPKPKKKKKKEKHVIWFETCSGAQLKALCKACKLPVSGTKKELAYRVFMSSPIGDYHHTSVANLKLKCREKLIIQSGNKYDLILRLAQHEFKTGDVKAAAPTKERKEVVITPQIAYSRIEKKIKAVTLKKYQGSKRHAEVVFEMMRNLIEEHCFEGNQWIGDGKFDVRTDDLVASVELCKAIFQSFYDHCHHMQRVGYGQQDFRESLNLFGQVLQVAKSQMSTQQVEEVVDVLESIQACLPGYDLCIRSDYDACVHYSTGHGSTLDGRMGLKPTQYTIKRKAGEDAAVEAIRVVMPDYDATKRPEKKAKHLSRDIDPAFWRSMVITT